jgi:hypothetical protein
MQPPLPETHKTSCEKEVKPLFDRVGIKSGICACNNNESKKVYSGESKEKKKTMNPTPVMFIKRL